MDLHTIQSIFRRNNSTLAFLIGNGINRYYKTGQSWHDVLLSLWRTFSFSTKSSIPKGISTTEFYDLLELQDTKDGNIQSKIQQEIQSIFSRQSPNKAQNKVLSAIQDLSVPLFTTNIDDLIPKSLDLRFFNGIGGSLTDFYPWECYYSNRYLDIPTRGFAVWYVNGMKRYHRSIKLGLTHYMGNVDRARKWIHGNSEDIAFTEKNSKHWPGLKSWLHVVFNCDLFIFGLGLEENEVFLRWLLIERARYFRRFPKRKRQGWYLRTENEENRGRDFFLESLGFEILVVPDYADIYDRLWDNAT